MSRPLRAVIQTQSLQHNLQRVRHFAPNSKVMAVIKADGYGHGIVTVAQALSGADALAVASIDEAITIQDALSTCPPICLLEGVFHQDELIEAAAREFRLVVHSRHQLEWLERANLASKLSTWLKVSTGMNRLGIDAADFNEFYQRLQDCANVESVGVMTHFACADEPANDMTTQQLARFFSLDIAAGIERSAANSAGILQWPDSQFDWVRPGIMLYGSSPIPDQAAEAYDLKPVMQLESELVSVHRVRKGESVGYGAGWIAKEDTVIGVVACGYGDGYPRHAPSGTPVLVNGQRVPIVGRVSMDMITVDLGSQTTAKVGDPAELWGNTLSVDEIATQAGTISYELLCQVTRRVPRVVLPEAQ